MSPFRYLPLFFLWGLVLAAENAPLEASRYRMFVRDLVRIAVHGEPEMTVDRRIDGLGEINVPLIGQVKISGLTASAAQDLIASRYREEEIFIRPQVVVSLIEYSPKEVTVLGQVTKQGKQTLPPESATISIVDVIASAGGLTRISKGDAVRVTRKDEKGVEQSTTVNVEKLIDGSGKGGETFLLQPGDVVFVPERLF
ncbi:MAG TPA: polysaccharide biosynthesis/export family protein [Opitutaceae bacterium]